MKNKYQISDTTTNKGGRMTGDVNSFYSEWDEDLNLLSLKVNGHEVVKGELLDTRHFNYHLAKTAKGRHLKRLKKKLGITKDSEKKMRKVLVKPYFDFKFRPEEIEVGAKMFGGQRVSSIFIFEDTEENRVLAREHNELIEKKEEIERRISELTNKMKK